MSRRLSNGRSPLVRKQSQITAFFTPGKSPNPDSSSLPLGGPGEKTKKPLLSVPPPSSTTPPNKTGYLEEVVGRRIKVFWPLDKAWYEGTVVLFDVKSGKHLVEYDDADEELLDLKKEKVEFVEEEKSAKVLASRRKYRRKVVVSEDEEEGNCTKDDEDLDMGAKSDTKEDSDEEMELEEEEEYDSVAQSSGRSWTRNLEPRRKRKEFGVEKPDCVKKFKFEGNADKSASLIAKCKSSVLGVLSGRQLLDAFESTLTGDVAERFGKREAEKFSFLGKDRKDAHGRCPGDADYDARTLYLPPDFLKNLTGGQRQWWEFKSKHMDKVLFFKMGKFYELFEMDAHVGVKDLDLQYMKGEQPHCGFPEKNFSMNLEKLARKGYRVLVVEQTETPEQLEIRRKEMGSKDKVVKREICAVVTKGTLMDGDLLFTHPDTSYLMAITESCEKDDSQKGIYTLGVCIVDVSTSKFVLGQFEDDPDRHFLCALLTELRPAEIIKPSKILRAETERALRNYTRNPLVNDLIPFEEFWDAKRTIDEIKSIYNQSVQAKVDNMETVVLPEILSHLASSEEGGCYALSALGGCLFYLRQAFLDVSLLKCSKFELLPCDGFANTVKKPYMILDSSALHNLEILENSQTGVSSGTLFSHLDHCATSCGKRLLKSWLARPLYDINLIAERQDAIAAIKDMGLAAALEFRKELSRLPDMERLLARLFASCEGNGRDANRVILYEDAAKRQVQELISALRGCTTMVQACSLLANVLSTTGSSLLCRLLTPGKGLPDVASILSRFKDSFDWSEAAVSGRIIPHEGGDDEYDSPCKRAREIETNLSKYLKEQRREHGDASINYVNVGKELYLLEVPESLCGALPGDYELRSSRKGYFRYWTPQIRKWLSELSNAEAEKESKLKSIMQRLIELFKAYHSKWRQLISVIAELDALISLAIASDYYEGPTCRPVIKGNENGSSPYLSAKSLGHPTLRSDALCKGSFVSNDISIGGSGQPNFILLTGPNMGGKSTLLRQVCLAVILAQIGADVPAESFELSLVDRIFVRMGATDHIMSGQSTFLVELTETAAMLSSATQYSLVALDELGRGTSTSDGQAIAGAVLEYMTHQIQCRGLFSTHYHRLAVDYEKDPKVAFCHMACQVGIGSRGVEEVAFLYRLTPGSCPKSYGVNVAHLAGIPASVLQSAVEKSNEFENVTWDRMLNYENRNQKFINNDEVAIIQDIIHAAQSWSCSQNSKPVELSLLVDIRQKSKLLLARS